MNKVIPNGAICLFSSQSGGSRNGKIVLIESSDTADGHYGAHYTVKEYESIKVEGNNSWYHQKILLKPLSYNETFETLEITDNPDIQYRVIGEFLSVL